MRKRAHFLGGLREMEREVFLQALHVRLIIEEVVKPMAMVDHHLCMQKKKSLIGSCCNAIKGEGGRRKKEMGSIGSPDELAQWQKPEVPSGGGDGGQNEKIYVSVRLRPLNVKEIEQNDPAEWESINNTTVVFKNGLQEKSMYPSAYTFDRVFGFQSTTKQVYEEGAKEVALSVVSGINSSVFAYGQTSSGKTYTMTGITDYTVQDIYDYIEKHEEREFTLKFSAMEIYNEAVRDLLSADSSPLRLLDDPERGTIVEKLTEETLRDQDHLKELLSVCEAQRQIGETSLNEMSSRSHQILRLTIESAPRKFVSRESSSTLSATVNFVDLAGSERASQALSAGTRLKEGCHINRSLLTLGTVIRKLSKGRNGHVPYRDSKLTRILQSSLGGNARTAIICTMSPARSHTEQSRNTLLFASCAKEISTNAHVNVVMSDKALVKHLQKELARLENELRCSGSTPFNSHDEALRNKEIQIKKMETEIKDLRQQRDLAQSRLEDLLRSMGDDQTSHQWDESSPSSLSLHNVSEDALSISEVSGIAYQNPYIDSERISTLYEHYNPNENHLVHSEETEETVTSPTHSVCSSTFIRVIPQQGIVVNLEAKSQSSEDHCKEVQCIEIHTLRTSKDEEFNLLLPYEDHSLLPLTDEDKNGDHILPLNNAHSIYVTDELLECVTLNSSKPDVDETYLLPSARILSPKELPIVRSSSRKLNLMTSLISSWCEDVEQDDVELENKTPPESILKDFAERAEEDQGILPLLENVSTDSLPKASRKLTFHDDAVKTQDVQIVPEEDVVNLDPPSVEVSKAESQKQLPEDQETQTMENEDNTEAKKSTNDVVVDPVPSPLDSPPDKWALEFGKKQQEIADLWHACNVSLVHRTYFFLLFKGDPVDSFYMEVEIRRLSFMKSSLCHGSSGNILAEDGHMSSLASSLRHLRHERDMLYRKMQKKLSFHEKMELYAKWGIGLNTKQRRLQVARKIWTATDMQHIRESASVVAKLIGPVGEGQALKEMFGLSFTPQLSHRGSFSWMQGKSFK